MSKNNDKEKLNNHSDSFEKIQKIIDRNQGTIDKYNRDELYDRITPKPLNPETNTKEP